MESAASAASESEKRVGSEMSVNRVILVGRLGREPETRYTSEGTAVCNFSLATDESYKDKSGEKQKKTEWHKLVAWGKLAEIVQQYLTKGSLVYIEGKLQTRKWEKDGQERQSTEIVCQSMKMLGGGKREESKGEKPEPSEAPEIDDSSIPF